MNERWSTGVDNVCADSIYELCVCQICHYDIIIALCWAAKLDSCGDCTQSVKDDNVNTVVIHSIFRGDYLTSFSAVIKG